MAKKLLDRFENSPKVWTIKQEPDENGRIQYVTKVYNNIADAHRDNPKISCSHIEDYCNATFFTKQNHWFTYVGYMMAPNVDEIISGKSNEPVQKEKETSYYPETREEHIAWWSGKMWKDIATTFLGNTYNSSIGKINDDLSSDSIIANTIASMDEYLIPDFMRGLYSDGWHKNMLKSYAIDWCSKNLTHFKLLENSGTPVPITIKPEKRYWCSQEYKQQNYL